MLYIIKKNGRRTYAISKLYGAQDIYLAGNPQITFFKVVYRRHTNFSMESIEQTLNGTYAVSSRQTSTISRNGDLVYKMYIEVGGTVATEQRFQLSHGSRPSISKLGGQESTNSQVPTWPMRGELSQTQWFNWNSCHKRRHRQRNRILFQKMHGHGGAVAAGPTSLHPVPFGSCRNAGLALPLIALQYHEVKVMS